MKARGTLRSAKRARTSWSSCVCVRARLYQLCVCVCARVGAWVRACVRLALGEAEKHELELADVAVDAERGGPLRDHPQVHRHVPAARARGPTCVCGRGKGGGWAYKGY